MRRFLRSAAAESDFRDNRPHQVGKRNPASLRQANARRPVRPKTGAAEKGTVPFCRNGPKGALHKRGLSPFPAAAEENWRKNPNLVVGDFEQGADGVPKGWDSRCGQRREPLGTLVRWMADPDRPNNKIIRFTLDKEVAESEGVMYYSDYFPVEEGRNTASSAAGGPTDRR